MGAWGQLVGLRRRAVSSSTPGNFAYPNLRNQLIGDVVEEGLRAEHQTSPLGSVPFGDPLQFGGHSFAVTFEGKLATAVPDPRYAGMEQFTREQNRLLVFRRNRALSNGGFSIGSSNTQAPVGHTPPPSASGTGAYTKSIAWRPPPWQPARRRD